MTAHLKTRVLVREEKGIGTISMKRMIFSFMGSGFVFFFIRLTPLAPYNVIITLLSMLVFFFFTGDRFGIPRWRWILINWRGVILLRAQKSPGSLSAHLCRSLKWDASKTVILKSSEIFASTSLLDSDWSGMEILETDEFEAGGFELLSDHDVIVIG